VDHLGGAVDLIGLCQGGWLSLMYAARFPAKVRRLVLAGAPIDIAAGDSILARIAHDTPSMVFRELVGVGEGRMLGRRILEFSGLLMPDAAGTHETLQVPDALEPQALAELMARFRDWHDATLDLPGVFYLQVIERLFKANELATGRFVALGRTIDLAAVRAPLYLLAGRDDELVAPAQILATRHLVGTPERDVVEAFASCHHLGLFMGGRTLVDSWPPVAHWLTSPSARGLRSKRSAA
jgi:poly(3-hydroxybutyrate) depolymerase